MNEVFIVSAITDGLNMAVFDNWDSAAFFAKDFNDGNKGVQLVIEKHPILTANSNPLQ